MLLSLLLYAAQIENLRLAVWIFDDDDDEDAEVQGLSKCRREEEERETFAVGLLSRFPVEGWEEEEEKAPVAEREDVKFGRIDNFIFLRVEM